METKIDKIDCELIKKIHTSEKRKNAWQIYKYALSQIDFNSKTKTIYIYIYMQFQRFTVLMTCVILLEKKRKIRETKQSTRDEFSSILFGDEF